MHTLPIIVHLELQGRNGLEKSRNGSYKGYFVLLSPFFFNTVVIIKLIVSLINQ